MAYTDKFPRPPATGLHWLTLNEYGYYDDISGTEMMELRTQIRADIDDLKKLCQTHDITICEIAERSMFNHLNFGQVIKTAAGFATQEDLAMVRLLMGKK